MTTARTFHRFSGLPYELRRQIYILATSSRLVYVQEGFGVEDKPHEAEDDGRYVREDDEPGAAEAAFLQFSRQLSHGPLQFNLRLHPDLAYFAENWRTRMAETLSQPTQATLEDYGFITNKTLHEPWTITPETPRIPIDRLHENPRLAFELVRETWLYSETPIPAFLHVCTESRQVLKNWGYRLAFGTRSHAPRIWFHFERDILYAPVPDRDFAHSSSENFTSVLSGCPWDMGRFDVESLRNLRRVVLPGSWSPIPNRGLLPQSLHFLTRVIKLLPNSEALFLEDWQADDIGGWFFDTVWWKIADDHVGSRTIDGAYEPRVCIPWEPIDAIGSTCWFNSSSFYDDEHVGPPAESLRHAIGISRPPLPSIANYSHLSSRWIAAQRFREDLKVELNQHASYKSFIPEIVYVHTCPQSLSQRFLQGRHQFWQDFTCLQKQAHSELALGLLHPAVQEHRFRVNLDKISLETRSGIESTGWHVLNSFIKGKEQYRDALTRWYFCGPRISEPGLSPI